MDQKVTIYNILQISGIMEPFHERISLLKIQLLSNFNFHVTILMVTDFVMIREHLFVWPDAVSYSCEFIITTETMDLSINDSLFKTKLISVWLWIPPYCHTECLTALLMSTMLINFNPENKIPDKTLLVNTSWGPKWTGFPHMVQGDKCEGSLWFSLMSESWGKVWLESEGGRIEQGME